MCRSRSFDKDAVERGLGHFRVDAAQSVVSAELDDHRVGALRDRPVQAAEPAGRSVARHPGIGDADRDAFGLQRLRQSGRKSAVRRQPKPALSESPSTTIFTGRSSAARAPPASMKTAAASDQCRKALDPDGFCPICAGS